jgi:hypothetical protein
VHRAAPLLLQVVLPYVPYELLDWDARLSTSLDAFEKLVLVSFYRSQAASAYT